MIKNIYKALVLIFAFVGALFYFGSRMGGNQLGGEKAVDMGIESFPVLTVTTGQNTINTLYGYSGTFDPAVVRQSITPVDKSKTIMLNILESPTVFRKLRYEIIDKESGEVYYAEKLNTIPDKKHRIPIILNYAMETSREYIFSITATTNRGRRIHYFTRLKYYVSETNLAQKVQFAMDFHNKTFNKEKSDDLAPNLEPDPNKDNSTLASVNIKSDINLITWAKLNPEVASDIVPMIKEYNTETACIQLNYYIKSNMPSQNATYHVKEFYRVRYTSSRLFLLAFERTMEESYDPEKVSLKKSQLKVGITSQTDMDLAVSEDKKYLYFARNGVLYQHDMEKNEISKIFSVFSNKAKKIYKLNNEHEIRINKLDRHGSVLFTVFGYVPRGEYEGRVAVILYKYSLENNIVEELVYLPMDTTYQQLKEDFKTYSYVNSKSVYYFTIAGVVYSYNILGKKLNIISENITDKGFVILESKNSYAWSSSLKEGYGDSITVLNLETDESKVMKTPNDKTYLRLLGVIDGNVVIGYVRKSDIAKTADGTKIVPCYLIRIVDTSGKVLKTYKRKSTYIQEVESIRNSQINGSVLKMNRCKKVGKNSYRKISGDSILNPTSTEKKSVSLVWRLLGRTLTEWYIQLPSSYILPKAPDVVSGGQKIVTSERAVHLGENKTRKYYVYALGKITRAYEDPAIAIQQADEEMGVVISSTHHLVWERGGSYLMNSISGMENVKVSNDISNTAACAYMVLKVNHVDADVKKLTAEKKTIYDMLAQYMDHPVNLSGVTLEQVLYFVSSGKPVIGMTGKKSAVVIREYTQGSVTVVNPNSGKSEVLSRSQADAMFKGAGNVFISYMN